MEPSRNALSLCPTTDLPSGGKKPPYLESPPAQAPWAGGGHQNSGYKLRGAFFQAAVGNHNHTLRQAGRKAVVRVERGGGGVLAVPARLHGLARPPGGKPLRGEGCFNAGWNAPTFTGRYVQGHTGTQPDKAGDTSRLTAEELCTLLPQLRRLLPAPPAGVIETHASERQSKTKQGSKVPVLAHAGGR